MSTVQAPTFRAGNGREVSAPDVTAWVRLRRDGADIDLYVGEHFIGRSGDSAIVLDDPLVSRQHARLVVAPGKVTIEDLGSRNGVYVAGRRIRAPRPLGPGDTVVVGGTTIDVISIDMRPLGVPSGRRDMLGNLSLEAARRVATTLSQKSDARARRLEAFAILGEASRRFLGRGQGDEAERVLERPLAEVLSTLRTGMVVEEEIIEFAARNAATLAQGTKKAAWVDYVFDLYAIHGAPLPDDVIELLERISTEIVGVDASAARAYVAVLRRRPDTTAGDAAIKNRIEALAHRFPTGA